jgi:chemotaxis protein CheX
MDVSYINPFITSTITTFQTMLNEEAKPGKASVKSSPYPTYDVSGIIGLSGEAQGVIALSFTKPVALRAVSKMLGAEIKIVGPELTDGIGELANIITGYAKQGLTQYRLSISLPNVIVGKNHVVNSPSGAPTILVPFTSGMGAFCMEICLRGN